MKLDLSNMAKNFNYSNFEDTIHCSFFSSSDGPNNVDHLCLRINTLIDSLSKDYIWHRDEFKVCVSPLNTEVAGLPNYISSTTCFGDNIEDEWFIVYLVIQITNEIKDMVVHMEDNDGNFLLIEAADYLPSWANPETTENRVFIYQSEVHLIPPEVVELNRKLDLQDAVKLVIKEHEKTKATKEIQEAIYKRISCYPQKIKDSHHRALVTLPVEIAALLMLKPSLISPIVTAYCHHDIVDEKCFKNVNFETQLVTVPILFTKYLYAMILHCKVPRIKNYLNTTQNNKEITLGWKLACGYEIIMLKSSEDIFNSKTYKQFISSLTKNGYFKDNLEDSKQYNELLEKAKKYFTNTDCPLSTFYCNDIINLINTQSFITQKELLKNRKSDTTETYEVDTEEWLNINPDELNTFLNTHYGKKILQSGNSSTPQVKSELASFLKQTSDFEGIEYGKEEQSNLNVIEFDSDEFLNSVEKMVNLVTENYDKPVYDTDGSEDIDVFIEDNLDDELASKLRKSEVEPSEDENIMKNLLQGIKEEITWGPSSTILRNLAVSTEMKSDADSN